MEEIQKKPDRRVTRTENAIHEAFQTLISEKKYSEISVKELTEKANITRKTFYLHYGTLDDVLREYLSELVQDVRIEMTSRSENGDEESQDQFDYLELFSGMSRRFGREQTKIRDLMRDENSRQVLHQILMEQQKRMWELYQTQYGLKPEIARMYGIFTTYGFNAVYMAWYENPGSISAEELENMTQDIADRLRDLPEKWRQSV